MKESQTPIIRLSASEQLMKDINEMIDDVGLDMFIKYSSKVTLVRVEEIMNKQAQLEKIKELI